MVATLRAVGGYAQITATLRAVWGTVPNSVHQKAECACSFVLMKTIAQRIQEARDKFRSETGHEPNALQLGLSAYHELTALSGGLEYFEYEGLAIVNPRAVVDPNHVSALHAPNTLLRRRGITG